MKNAVGWFEVYVNDMTRARKFYESVFEITFSKSEVQTPEMFQFPSDMQQYGAAGALVHLPGFEAGRNSVIVYFACEDCTVEEKRVIAAGGRVQKSKFSIGQFGFISLVFDSEGNMIGLHSQK